MRSKTKKMTDNIIPIKYSPLNPEQPASSRECSNMQPTSIEMTENKMPSNDLNPKREQSVCSSEHNSSYDNEGLICSQVDICGDNLNENQSTCKKMENGHDVTINENNEANHTNYDPYMNRNVQNPTSYFDTIIHLLKASLGTGILAMPCAFKNAGYSVGLIGTIVIGILCTYTIRLLVNTSYMLCVKRNVPSLTYAGTVEAAFEEGPRATRKFAPLFKFLTNMFLVLYQIGSSCVYVVFISSNLKTVGDVYFDPGTSLKMYMSYLLIPLILISWVRNLKLLSPFSGVANVFTGVSLAMIFYYVCRGLTFNDLNVRHSVGTLRNIPLFFGTVLFAMEAIGMVLPLENEMKNPKKFTTGLGVLNMSMLPITILYTVVGLLGYLKYGEEAKGSITLDLPNDELLSQIVKILLSLSIYMCYALSNFVAFDIIWKNIEPNLQGDKYLFWMEYTIRTSIVLTTFILAIAIPDLEKLISLIGAFCLSSVGLAFPAIVNFLAYFDLYYKNPNKKRFIRFCMSNLLIVMIAVAAFAIGVYTSLSNIINAE